MDCSRLLVYSCAYTWRLWTLSGTSARRGRIFARTRYDSADAVTVFEDDRALTVTDEASDEERFAAVGLDALGRLLVVIYTVRRGERIRMISARRATPRERQEYEKQGS